MIFDTHTHAYFDSLSHQEDEILARMDQEGVLRAVQIGCDLASSRQAVDLARRHPNEYRATIGIHPNEAQEMDEGRLNAELLGLQSLLSEFPEIIVAIGETGVDQYHLSDEPSVRALQIERQHAAFEAQSRLAKQYSLPLVIHTRSAPEATLGSIIDLGIERAVIHCFSEDIAFARALMKHSDGILFGFSGILTYKKSIAVQEVAALLPLDRILIETDAPFLAPQAVRGSVNESANTRYILDFLCSLREESREEIESALYRNSCRFYGWAE